MGLSSKHYKFDWQDDYSRVWIGNLKTFNGRWISFEELDEFLKKKKK